MDTLLKNKIT
ncbi:Protein of unknown function [Bacillus cytotoxicus]|uniref:Uncharacterized protein n=1 Tax=Bacillus cytotoxicus TaxID=580165 RepID=A0AAX2CGI0_9BACI|nr:Protein of unknown function [Bacillus cytotoxicus]SCN36073.1 Protein of unknown function [Bacillus cytotoxicus]